MAGIDPVTIGSLLILAAGGGSNFCQMPAPTRIDVVPKAQDIKFDYSKTLAQLQEQKTDTIDPYGFHGVTMTQGYMQGAIKMGPEVKIAYQTYPKYDAACVWYESIKIPIEIDPTIVIAKEVYNDPCMHKAVKDHEMKHIRVDREIVNKYAKTIGVKVYEGLKERGFISQPLRSADAKSVGERMQKTVFQIVQHESKKMELERAELQQAVDSLEEYERVSALCPDFMHERQAEKRRKNP